MADQDYAEEVLHLVDEYCRTYGIAVNHDIYDLTPDNRRELPFSRCAGCYCFYAEDGRLLYIGKASMSHTLGPRIMSWFKVRPEFAPRHSGWTAPPRYLLVFKVNNHWEAPSLEEYLIGHVKPPPLDCIMGIGRVRNSK